MATNDTAGEEIIEKKATSPVATTCLAIACVALIGAITFQVAEVAAYRSGGRIPMNVRKGVGQDKADKFLKTFHAETKDILTKSAVESSGELAPEGEGALSEEPTGAPPVDEEPAGNP